MSKEHSLFPHAESVLTQLRDKFLSPEIIEGIEAYRREVEETFVRLKEEGELASEVTSLPMEYRIEIMDKYGLRGSLEPKRK